MKRCHVLLISLLPVWLFLAACNNSPPVEPTPALPTTNAPATMPADPLQTSEPTAVIIEAADTPETPVFSGTNVGFDLLSMVIPYDLAAGGSGMLIPAASGETVSPWDAAPQHLQFTLNGYALQGKMFEPRIFVYPAAEYAELQENGAAAKSLGQLRALLEQSAMVNVRELPAVPFFNVMPALTAQVKVISFQGGRGVRMVTQYAMGRPIINNFELIYHFQGLTDDGLYYVIAILPISAAGLPEDGVPGSPVPQGGVGVPDYDDMDADWMGYIGAAREMLQAYEPGQFNPGLDQLDNLIQSLLIAASD